jgi:hypothetical protein
VSVGTSISGKQKISAMAVCGWSDWTLLLKQFFSTKLKSEVYQIDEDLVENYNVDYLTTM